MDNKTHRVGDEKAGFNTNTGYQQKQNLPVPILQKGLHVTPSVRPKYI